MTDKKILPAFTGLEGEIEMKNLRLPLAVLAAVFTLVVPAFAAGSVANPSTGDNSMVTLALIIMGVAAVVIVAVLFFTRKKK